VLPNGTGLGLTGLLSRARRNGGAGERMLGVITAASAQDEVLSWMLKPAGGGSGPGSSRRTTGERSSSGSGGGSGGGKGLPGALMRAPTGSFKRAV
jgi:hypothetical protein